MERDLVHKGGHSTRVMFWDFSGESPTQRPARATGTGTVFLAPRSGAGDFSSVAASYFNGAGAALLLASMEDPSSLRAAAAWQEVVLDHCGGIPMLLVASRGEVEPRHCEVTAPDLEAAAESMAVPFCTLDARDPVPVTEAVRSVVLDALRSLPEEYTSATPHSAVIPGLASFASPPPPPAAGGAVGVGLPAEFFDSTAPPLTAVGRAEAAKRLPADDLSSVPVVAEDAPPEHGIIGSRRPVQPPPPPPPVNPRAPDPAVLEASRKARRKRAKRTAKARQAAEAAEQQGQGGSPGQAAVAAGRGGDGAAAPHSLRAGAGEGDSEDDDEELGAADGEAADTGPGAGGKKKKKKCIIM